MSMRRRFVGVGAAGAVLALAGCGGDNLFPDFVFTGPSAVTGTLEGSVTTTAGPLGGVRVILVNRDSTLTDGSGRFRFFDLPAASYTVTLRVPLNHTLAPGDSAVRQVRVGPGVSDPVDWRLVVQGVGP